MTASWIERFETVPLMGILRGVKANEIAPLTEAVVASGLRTIEITMNTAGAPTLIETLISCGRERLEVGAGTVLSLSDYDQAMNAGATFIVMPTLVREVVGKCVADGVPVFPGALTPQEIFAAYEAGATMVKVFPSNLFGPSYFKDVRGPFEQIPLLACGGVNAHTVGAFFENGASAASFGGSIFKRHLLAAGAFDEVEIAIGKLIAAYRRAVASSVS